MKLIRKKLSRAGLSLLLSAIVAAPAAHAAEQPKPVYLKVDIYSIIYTQPTSPFIDAQGRLLIPLRTIEDLFGGKVSFDSSSRKATVDWLEKR